MTLTHRAVTSTIKGMTRLLCRIEDDSICQVPLNGPLILVCNHVNFLDIPLVYTHLQPRPVTGFVKVETWDNPLLGPLFNLWEAIPIRRGAVDRDAIRRGLEVLEEGKILAISPEGTRSGDGRLKRGHPGVTLIALLSGAPLLPLAYYGGETFHRNVRQLQRTDFHIRVGRLFQVRLGGIKSNRLVRQAITDEIMYQLASLLPPEYRGVYTDLEKATTEFLEFQATPA
jgi:1-acyl-sn-glycerol-3-phosphate acyltransferase